MVYIPLDEAGPRIEALYRDRHGIKDNKKLPVRMVADWFAMWINRNVLPEKGF
jgi:hypothetical protein